MTWHLQWLSCNMYLMKQLFFVCLFVVVHGMGWMKLSNVCKVTTTHFIYRRYSINESYF